MQAATSRSSTAAQGALQLGLRHLRPAADVALPCFLVELVLRATAGTPTVASNPASTARRDIRTRGPRSLPRLAVTRTLLVHGPGRDLLGLASEVPRLRSDFLMCSYCRPRFESFFTPRGGMFNSSRRGSSSAVVRHTRRARQQTLPMSRSSSPWRIPDQLGVVAAARVHAAATRRASRSRASSRSSSSSARRASRSPPARSTADG